VNIFAHAPKHLHPAHPAGRRGRPGPAQELLTACSMVASASGSSMVDGVV
jgi:hypothetical protein